MFNLSDPNFVSYLINLIAGFTQIILIFLAVRLRKYIVKNTISHGVNGILFDRRYLILIQVFFILCIGCLTLCVFYTRLNKNSAVLLISTTAILVIGLIIKELVMFWSIGLNHISSSIAKDTYSRAFNSTNNSFCLIGTNAFSFSQLLEFEQMLKRIRQCRGEVRILLTDPDSNGLIEAARNRNCKDNLYQCQGRHSLGQLINLRDKLGVIMEIRTYAAKNIDELPIFRSMFLDRYFCVASIAVYGREDHGKGFPQIFTKSNTNKDKAPRSMYNVVYRYFQGMWDCATPLSIEKEKEYLEYSKNSIQ